VNRAFRVLLAIILVVPAGTMLSCSKSEDKGNANLPVPDVQPANSAKGKGGPVAATKK
jgi:hypothetical protein